MIVGYFFFFVVLTFCACSSNENVLLELALDKSGENRSELEAVLHHYKDNQKKEEAARFLISNMIGKQVLDSNSVKGNQVYFCLLYTSPSPRDRSVSRMPSSA